MNPLWNEKKREGLSVALGYESKIVERLMKFRPKTYLYLPPELDTMHYSVSGATGSGKTSVIQHLVDSAKARAKREGTKLACVFSDPHGTYIKRYWKPGAWVGNPYDARGFSWCPTWELDLTKRKMSYARCKGMMRSLYVGKQSMTEGDNNSEFFTNTAIECAIQLICDHQPSEAQELAYWMNNPDEEIATRVTGKVKRDLDPGSLPQANGIISTLTAPVMALDAIPLSGWTDPATGAWIDNAPKFTVRKWSENPDADIFFTSDADTRDALQPLQSMLLDMILRARIKATANGAAPNTHLMIVIDELAVPQRLPMVKPFANESRKFNATLILGFQTRLDLDGIYTEKQARTIVAACKTQFYFRAGEDLAAKAQTENVGEIEYRQLNESFATTLGAGNKPRTVQIEIKKKPLVMPSQFTGLPDRVGYIKIQNDVLRCKVAVSPEYVAAEAFLPRADSPLIKGVKREKEEDPQPAGKKKAKTKNGTEPSLPEKSEEEEEDGATMVLMPGMGGGMSIGTLGGALKALRNQPPVDPLLFPADDRYVQALDANRRRISEDDSALNPAHFAGPPITRFICADCQAITTLAGELVNPSSDCPTCGGKFYAIDGRYVRNVVMRPYYQPPNPSPGAEDETEDEMEEEEE